ncbi:MAG: hypothetical protein M0008_08365 [Actinomycetota bacterium]|nr:hypothetical protein [Actinomycetota bacterium]
MEALQSVDSTLRESRYRGDRNRPEPYGSACIGLVGTAPRGGIVEEPKPATRQAVKGLPGLPIFAGWACSGSGPRVHRRRSLVMPEEHRSEVIARDLGRADLAHRHGVLGPREVLCGSALGSLKLSERQRAAPVIVGRVTGTIPKGGQTRTPSRGYVGADRVRHP